MNPGSLLGRQAHRHECFIRMEWMTGFEPANLLLGKQTLYQLSYIHMEHVRGVEPRIN